MAIPLTITCSAPNIRHKTDTFAFFVSTLKKKTILALHDDIDELLHNPDVIDLMEKCWNEGYNIGSDAGYEVGYDNGYEHGCGDTEDEYD